MASWQDGARYAPIERPYGFAAPRVAPLAHAAPTAPSAETPITPPVGFAAPTMPTPPLAELVPHSPALRDPREPFHSEAPKAASAWTPDQPITVTRVMDGASAWGAAHALRPQLGQPLLPPGQFPPPAPGSMPLDMGGAAPDPLNFPPPIAASRVPDAPGATWPAPHSEVASGPIQWPAGYPDHRPQDTHQRVSFSTILSWSSPVSLIAYLIAVMGLPAVLGLEWLGPLLLIVGISLNSRVRVGRAGVSAAGSTCIIAITVVIITMFFSPTLSFLAADRLYALSRLASGFLLVFTPLYVAARVKKGERPE